MVPILLLLGITFYNQSSSNVIIFESYNVMSNAMQAAGGSFLLQAQRNKEKNNMITVGE